MFGVKQLYYDLDSSALVQGFEFDGLPSNNALSGFMTDDFINTYFKNLNGAEILGYAAARVAVLAAATDGGQTAVWGIGPQGSLSYATCAAGSERDPAAWSHPVPLVPAAEQFAFYLNLNAGTSVLFAHIDGAELVRLTQDPVTAGWSQRSILLPPTAPDDMIELDTFTTHIQVTDDNQVPVPNAELSVTATSPVSVYLSEVYHLLSPSRSVARAVSTAMPCEAASPFPRLGQ